LMSKLKFIVPVVAAFALLLGVAAPASAATTVLPTPTGQYKVGEKTVFLVDATRSNRQVEAHVWYPTTATTGTLSRYLSQNATYDQTIALALNSGLDGRYCYLFFGTVNCFGAAPENTMYGRVNQRDTHAFVNAPIRTDLGQLPVVVLSPGFGIPSSLYSAVSEDLASNGYIVVSTSVTNEALANEVSNGVVQNSAPNATQAAFNQRIADYKFTLGQISTLPGGIGAQADLTHIGGGGHSWGGYTALEAAYSDPRITAVASLDGTPGWPTNTPATNMAMNNGVQKPVLRLQGGTTDDGSHKQAITWGQYASHPHGPLYQLSFAGAGHYFFSDACYTGYPSRQADPLFCGVANVQQTMDSVRAYTLAFFNKHLKGQAAPLLDAPSAQFPNVTFLP
jgi:predicted dienelactone hydrolase